MRVVRGANAKRFSPSRLREEEKTMSDLGIFSLLVVGRDLPPAFIPTSGADYRPVDRTIPIAQQRGSFRSKLPESADQNSQARTRTVS